jgi:tRNA (mo5U34)-methyltransferase
MDNRFSSAIQLNNQGVLLHGERKFAEADAAHKQCFAALNQNPDESCLLLAQSLFNRSALYRTMHEFHEAENLFQQAIRIWDQVGWPQIDSSDEMLWADVIESDGRLRFFSREVQHLRSSNAEILGKVIGKLGPWFQDFELMPGVSTNHGNRDSQLNKWKFLEPLIPRDLSGKTVLDIGCNSGFFSFEMKKRNADRVVGTDIMPHCLAQARFLSHWFDHPIELKQIDAYNVDTLGEFDFVIFIGVLYHLKHPLYALEKVSAICKDTMYLHSLLHGEGNHETLDNYKFEDRNQFNDPNFPRMYFIEKSFNSDESNWWIPNRSCLKAMARTAGFSKIEDTQYPEIIVCRKH